MDDPAILRLQFRQRKDLGSVMRVFQRPSNLVDWTTVASTSVNLLQDFGTSANYEARFPLTDGSAFFRVRYTP